jgi:outer membrane receptor for ferrienterochelin and colicin
MLGYAAIDDSVDVAGSEGFTRDFYLVRIPRLLSTMVVNGRSVRVPAGFEDVYRRGATGAGQLVTRERIDSINPRDVAGILYEVPFVHVSAREGSPNALSTTRCRAMMSGSSSSGRMVQVFFNGTPVSDPTAVNEMLRHLAPSSIQAVEVYNGPTNVPFIYQPACAVVAIWTRKS